MGALADEFAHPTFLPFPVIAARLLFAALRGALTGFEREWRARPAGLRTHILICVAAAKFGILAVEISHSAAFTGTQTASDPLHAVEAVTARVAFLAAGSILFTRESPRAPACGWPVRWASHPGFGLWQIAGLGAFLILVVMGLLHTFEQRLGLAEDKKLHGGADDRKRGKEDDRKDDANGQC